MREIYIGELFDGRVLLCTEPLPEDAPVERGPFVHGFTSKWRNIWRCYTRGIFRHCQAPKAVVCRCDEVL